VTGLELVAGYLVAYVVRKARRAAKGADAEVDRVIDAGLERLDTLVSCRLGEDPALKQLRQEAAGGTANQRTIQRVQLAVEDAVETDSVFEGELQQVLVELRAAGATPGVSAEDHGVAAGRDLKISAKSAGIAAGVIHGSVSTANPHRSGTARG
jgi:hypothetical protein